MPRRKSDIGSRSRNARRSRIYRANQTPEQRADANEQHRENMARTRARRSQEERESHAAADCLRQQNNRKRHRRCVNLQLQCAGFQYDFTPDYSEQPYVTSGPMDEICLYCNPETPGVCCAGGTVKSEPLHSSLCDGLAESNHFLMDAHKYNSLNQMTTFDANDVEASGFNPHFKDVHSSLFLQYSDYGQQFLSEEMKTDHILSDNARDQPITSEIYGVKEEQIHVKDESVIYDGELSKPSCKEHSNNDNPGPNNLFGSNEQDLEMSPIHSTESKAVPFQVTCDNCGVSYSSKSFFLRHKRLCVKNPFSDLNVAEQNGSEKKGAEQNEKGRTGSKEGQKTLANKMRNSRLSGSSGTKCSCCGEECGSPKGLRYHFLQYHKPIKCNLCETTSDGFVQARRHKNAKHVQPKYKCDKCWKTYNYIAYYERHLDVCNLGESDPSSSKISDETILNVDDPELVVDNRSGKSTGHRCSHCGIVASSVDSLTRHVLMRHDPVACDFCGITLPNLSEAQTHVKSKHQETKLKCPHCTMQFTYTVRLKKHISICENRTIPCDYCGKMFKDSTAMKAHVRSVCLLKESNKTKQRLNTELSISERTESSFVMDRASTTFAEHDVSKTKCYYCNEEHCSSGYLFQHLKIHHKLTKCDVCGMTCFGLSSTRYHKVIFHTETKYDCKTCGEKFVRKKDYMEHIFTCENKNSCELCGRTFKKLATFKQHNKRDHPPMGSSTKTRDDQDEQKPIFPCKICGIVFHRWHKRHYHKLTVHADKMLQCAFCSKKFHFKFGLDSHELVCATLAYPCEFCGQKYKSRNKLEGHKTREHPENSPSQISNIECTDSFEQQCQNSIGNTSQVKETRIGCKTSFAFKKSKLHDNAQLGSREVSVIFGEIESLTNGESFDLKVDMKMEPCSKYQNEHDGIQSSALLQGVAAAQFDAGIVPEIKMEIDAEEPMLQEYQ